MKNVRLNNGIKMPIIGTGTNTYGKDNNEYRGALNADFSALESAINLGYRSIDAAVSYRNERGVGKTVAESKVPRDEFFITSKIPRDEIYFSTKEAVRNTIDSSLANFETDYLDLYLIHHPIENKEYFKHTWEVFEEYYKAGKLKSIGVSNFDQTLINEMENFSTIVPAVNQIQINLKEKNEQLIGFLKEKNITPVAWGPMKVTSAQKEILARMGEKYNKTWAQVLLRYQTQHGIVVIPKSHQPKNQAENLNLFDFELTNDEINRIANL
ncbi:MAG: aldo/keto reductase [Atopostipes suicloacalis]|nr:aldo/keto reductase [Atopostipes suicloacalis]